MSIVIFFLAFGAIALIVRIGRAMQQHLGRRDNDDSSNSEERARRRTLEPRIFQLAHRLNGSLTVSDVVVETGSTADEVERILQDLVDNNRVRMEVREDGIIFYEFPEIIARFRHELE